MVGDTGSLSLVAGQEIASRFKLIRRIGSGRFCDVWVAADRQSNAEVAVKVLRDSALGPALREEWQTLRAINHPGIVRPYDFFDTEVVFYAMQYIDGSPLTDLNLSKAGEVTTIAMHIADTLAYLHAKQVVHGDIAPGNVLLDRGGAVVLIDFGSTTRGEVAVGLGAGTPGYRPDEAQDRLARPADDCFALGIVTEQLLSKLPAGEHQPQIQDFVEALQQADVLGDALADARADLEHAGLLHFRLAGLAGEQRSIEQAPISAAQIAITREATTTQGAVRRPTGRSDEGSGLSRQWVLASLVVLVVAVVYVVVFLEPPSPSEQASPATIAATTPAAAPSENELPASADDVIDDQITFSEGEVDESMRTDRVRTKNATDRLLGELLTTQEVLEARGIDVWGGADYRQALADYDNGDQFYLAKDYVKAGAAYQRTIDLLDALVDRIEPEFSQAIADAESSLLQGDGPRAARYYERALAITPADPTATTGLERANRLEDVLRLTRAGEVAERDGDLDAAQLAFAKAIEADELWQPAIDGAERVTVAITDRDFRVRMSEGFFAFDEGRLREARIAFSAARQLKPNSREPIDGLQQVDQQSRLLSINRHLASARQAEQAEDWPAAKAAYERMLTVDDKLVQARDGLQYARARIALDEQLQSYLDNPDRLSEQTEIEAASGVLLRLAKIDPQGPRLLAQKSELSKVLRRAASPLRVELISDALTDVAVYRVGKLGKFERHELELRPGVYTVVGSRPGFKDVRLTVRVAPEQAMQPVIVRCDEPI